MPRRQRPVRHILIGPGMLGPFYFFQTSVMATSSRSIESTRKRSSPTGYVPFALGFRPFFLAAGIYAVLLMGLWLAVLHGSIAPGELPPPVWHGHEMLFEIGRAHV